MKKDKNYSNFINRFLKSLIILLIIIGVGFILGSIWCSATAQNVLIGLGSGFITSAVITILFELRSLIEKKNNTNLIYNTLLQELKIVVSLFTFYLYFFIDENDEEKCLTDFLNSKREQLNNYLKIKIEQNKEITNFDLLYDHISISTCERTEIKKCIDRAYELSALYLSIQAINNRKYEVIKSLHSDYNHISEGILDRGNLAITAFCFFLNDIENLITEFEELTFYNYLIFKGGEKKVIKIKDKDKLTEQQILYLNAANERE